MNARLTLQIAFAVMASLGTILLGMGSQNVVLPVVAVFVAITSVYFTDTVGWIKLNRTVGSVAALAAVGLSLIDFYQLGRERQLLAIAYLLIYLQIVVMYQRKDERIYWQLFMLSFLQVVVAAALNFSTTFGALLALYLFVALFVLCLFFLYREANRLQRQNHDVVVLDQLRASPARPRNGSQAWPSAEALQAVWTSQSVPRHVGQRAVGDGLLTIALTLVFFLLLPRSGELYVARSVTGQRMVGFTDTVKLGDLGNSIEDTSSVMRVWFRDPQNQMPYRLHRPPLFRGTVVNHYENRSWTLKFLKHIRHRNTRLPMPELDDGRPILQKISLEPQREATVCTVYPAFETGQDVLLAFDSAKQQIVRIGPTNTKRDFTIATTGFLHGLQLDITPVREETERTATQDLLQLPESDGPDPLENLKQVAAEVIQQSGVSLTDRIGKARALEDYFLNSDRFRYALRTQRANPNIDPVEDFIANNPNGHCEYFSSALTLMLRSQDIPARMVIGFNGGQWNSLGGYYQVRQLHAHSWVEVLLDVDDIPPHHPFADLNRKGWLRLDPTPGIAADEELNAQLTWEDRLRDWMNYGEYLWSNYVVNLNAKRQREGIYEPLASSAEQIAMVFSKEFWTVTLPRALKAAARERTLPLWGAWLLGLVTCIGLLFFLLTRRWLARTLRWPAFAPQLARSGRQPGPTATSVEFYRRLEALLRRHGMQRPAAQTQREFAIAVGGQLAEKPSQAAVAGIPKLLVDYFYRVRYGGARLEPQENEQLQQSLQQLAAALKVRL
ncbi:MAG: DUF3488 and transglutaminase-like domain-containing protein [Planctomycetota bacterium]|nr:DUF3488 and transglutaminase-like domain-containing protein [Planctomycetota bacterium]